jgi:hypothetical protein
MPFRDVKKIGVAENTALLFRTDETKKETPHFCFFVFFQLVFLEDTKFFG